VKPLYFEWPEEENSYKFNATQYMFGNSFLVAPIISPVDPLTNTTRKTIWFPPGLWVRWQTGEQIFGPSIRDSLFGFSDIPFYARAGSIIPLKKPTLHGLVVDPLVIAVVPGAMGDAEFYEDDGETLDYQKGKFSKTKIQQQTSSDSTLLTIEPNFSGDGFMGQLTNRSYEINFRGFDAPGKVECNGVLIMEKKDHSVPGWWMEAQEGGKLSVVVVALGNISQSIKTIFLPSFLVIKNPLWLIPNLYLSKIML